MVQDIAMQYALNSWPDDLLNGTIFDDPERFPIQISRTCHYLTLNIRETVRDTDSYNDIVMNFFIHHE